MNAVLFALAGTLVDGQGTLNTAPPVDDKLTSIGGPTSPGGGASAMIGPKATQLPAAIGDGSVTQGLQGARKVYVQQAPPPTFGDLPPKPKPAWNPVTSTKLSGTVQALQALQNIQSILNSAIGSCQRTNTQIGDDLASMTSAAKQFKTTVTLLSALTQLALSSEQILYKSTQQAGTIAFAAKKSGDSNVQASLAALGQLANVKYLEKDPTGDFSTEHNKKNFSNCI